MTQHTLLQFAARLLAYEADLKLTEEACVEKACKMIEKEAKAAIGTYRFDWEPLKPETIAHKARGDTPLLETGELKESIEHTVGREGAEVVGYVGTNDPIAKYHELGTRTIPPRSFLGEAAMRKEHKIHEMMGRVVVGTFVAGELYHALHMAYEAIKKLVDELVPDEEDEHSNRGRD
jgi:hypothetical protein